jgi:hypothetical protein
MIVLRPLVGSEEFIRAWESALAFKGETVLVWSESSAGEIDSSPFSGILLGLESDGGLGLETASGVRKIQFGEIRLRPG